MRVGLKKKEKKKMHEKIIVPLFEVDKPTANNHVYTMECVEQLMEQVKENKCFVKLYDDANQIRLCPDDFIGNIEGYITQISLDKNICYATIIFSRITFGLDCEGEVHEEIVDGEKILKVDKITKAVGISILRDGK